MGNVSRKKIFDGTGLKLLSMPAGLVYPRIDWTLITEDAKVAVRHDYDEFGYCNNVIGDRHYNLNLQEPVQFDAIACYAYMCTSLDDIAIIITLVAPYLFPYL